MTTSQDSTSLPEPNELAPMHDDVTEQVVIGSMMLSEEAAAAALEIVAPADFWGPRHRILAEVIRDHLYRDPVDPAALMAHLHRHGLLDKVGGQGYLSDLRMAGMAASTTWHAKRVVELARRRRLEEALMRSHQAVRDPALESDEASSRVQSLIVDATTDASSKDIHQFGDDFDDLFAHLRAPDPHAGISTGLGSLDDIIGRLKKSQLVIVAGRPGMGKSVLAADIARHTAWHQAESVLFCSLEMGLTEVEKRMLSAEGDVPLKLLTDPPPGGVPEPQMAKLEAVRHRTEGSFLWMEDSGVTTVSAIRSRAVRLQRTVGLALIVVDYLQLLGSDRPRDNRTQEVSEVSRALKLMAIDLGVPVVAVAQLSRAVEGRADKRPQLSDLRESGAIEQDADIVVMLHRESYYEPEERPGEIDLLVVKNRNGETRSTTAAAQLHKSRIVDMNVPPEPGA